ncbi:diacylglycerol/lipid kinase family protein [Bacillus sp. B-jedd]|uniref:diacylglycerol/lipid kinase family protein n=1 Tax=Bacillus sp. B-jedd TaxID=1476857 RepID=UPI0005156F54|nr:diacylglycerol kinase family protein [Bacillus sp. B-jedd]CEG28251.1 putative phospholipid kinase [Bacillus sp. B-jedd]
MKLIYIIVNPKAGNGKCRRIWKEVDEQLAGLGISYEAFFTDYPGHGAVLALRAVELAAGRPAVIVAVGGDGTAHEVLNGIGDKRNISFAFIPGGSGNDFSRGFRLPPRANDALVEMLGLVEAKPAYVDCGSISINGGSRLFINSAGIGFDALVSKKANESVMKGFFNKLSLGKLVYVYILLKELFTYKRSTIELTIDGKRHVFEKVWFVTMSNQPYYGGGMIISPEASPNDGELDITVVHKLSKAKLLLVFMSVFGGKHIYFKEVRTFKGKEITFTSSPLLHIHADGEYLGMSSREKIKAIPGSVGVLSKRLMNENTQMRGEANG